MADNIIEEQQVAEQPVQEQQNTELAQQMAISLGGGLLPENKEVIESTEKPVTATEPPVFQFQTFTEKFGWQTPEDAAKEIEELRGFKSNHVKEELKFENPQSETLFKAIQAGKGDEVYEILAQQKKLEALTTAEITKDNADAIVKLGMQLKYKDLTESEIDYKFKKQFSIPKEPVIGDLDDEEEFKQKHSEWKGQVAEIEMEKIIEAKLAKPDLELAKSKLVLPTIAESVNEDFIQWQKSLEEQPIIEAAMKEEFKAVTPKSVETKVNFNDEANKIAFEFQYEPSGESLDKAKDMASDMGKFFSQFSDQAGNLDHSKLLKALHFSSNAETILIEAMKQAKNATIKSMLPDNSSGGAQRQIPQGQEMSELDKMMQASLAGYTR